MQRFFTLICLFILVVACNKPATETSNAETTTEAAPTENKIFGAKEDFSNPISYDMMLGKMEIAESDTLAMTVKAKVNDVCQMKGCWITIGEDDTMVKFKDYGFFMPKDIGGREVIMRGNAYYQTTSVDELRHYAEDAGKSAEEIAAITEPKKELRFLASGVMLLN